MSKYQITVLVLTTLLAAIFTLGAILAWADPLPVPNTGGSCPHGYLASGSYCVPSQGAQQAIPKPPGANCPWGWLASGNSCLKSGS